MWLRHEDLKYRELGRTRDLDWGELTRYQRSEAAMMQLCGVSLG